MFQTTNQTLPISWLFRVTSLPINHSGKEIYDANVPGDVQSPMTVDNATLLCRM